MPADQVGRLAIVPSELLGVTSMQVTAGRFEHADGEVRFLPRFPLVPGTAYTLLLNGVAVVSTTVAPTTETPRTRVTAIYPTAHQVPLNLLKIYVQFSAPMAEDQACDAIQVSRADNGQQLDGVFVPMEPGLWDRHRTRLTLLLDPGRLKRGLAPHVEMGYPLQDGVPVVVRVHGSARDARGLHLLDGAERRFEVVAAVRQHVTPGAWRVQTPRTDCCDPLLVEFDRPLDRALLEHLLVVMDAHSGLVEGTALIGDGELTWSFTPHHRWRLEPYVLRVDPRLEDLAGNSLTRVFDRDLTRAEDAPLSLEFATVHFEVRHDDVSVRA